MAGRKQVLWLITVTVIGNIVAVPRYGPYEIIPYRLESCEDEGTGQVHFDYKIRYAGGGNHVYNSTFRILLPIDEHFKWQVEVAIWGNQGWRPKAWSYTANGCKEVMKTLGRLFRKLYKASGVDVEGCPFPTGTFTPNNFIVEARFDSFPIMFYEKNRAINTFSYKGVKIGCLIIYYDVVPKKANSTNH